MYPLMIVADLIYVSVLISAVKNIKRTILIWVPLSLLFNSQVCVFYSPQAVALTVAMNLSLIVAYFAGVGRPRNVLFCRDKFSLKSFMLVMGFSILLSTIFSVIPFTDSVKVLVKTVVVDYLMVYIFFRCMADSGDVRLFGKVVVFVVLVIVFDGLIEMLSHLNLAGDFIYFTSPHTNDLKGRSFYVPYSVRGGASMRFGLSRCYSFFGLHISFGATCAVIFYFLMTIKRKMFKIYEKDNSFYQLVLNIAIVFAVIGVFISNSKTPLLGFLVVIFAFYGFNSLFKARVLLPLIMGVLVLFFFFPEYINNILSLTDESLAEEGGGSSASMRKMQLQYILKMFYSSPLVGNGINAAAYFSRNVIGFDKILGAESRWFKLLADQGVLGCLAYVFQYFVVYRFGKKIIPRKELFFFLLSVLVMETVTGGINMLLWLPCMIAVRRMYLERMSV